MQYREGLGRQLRVCNVAHRGRLNVGINIDTVTMDRIAAKQIIEALLFASERPLSIEEVRQVLEEQTTKDIRALIDELKDEYEAQARGFRIYEVAGGYQVCTHPGLAPWLKKLHRSRRTSRFSRPALETLAIVAYRQPVTRAEVESIRGVNVEGVLRTLLEKEMVGIKGRKDSPGRPIIYGTTDQFLEYFGLRNLSELPTLEELVPPDVAGSSDANETVSQVSGRSDDERGKEEIER